MSDERTQRILRKQKEHEERMRKKELEKCEYILEIHQILQPL